jgi:hypothetical protein
MDKLTIPSASETTLSGFDWFARSERWLSYRPAARSRPKKFRYREPLILCGHGAHSRVDHASLLIRNGFTHYPQKREEIRLFPGDADLPDRIVMLDGSGGITFDALTWMAEQKITLVRLNWRGEVSFVGNSSGNYANWKIVDSQKTFRETRRSLECSRRLLEQKIYNSISTIKNVFPEIGKTLFAFDPARYRGWCGGDLFPSVARPSTKMVGPPEKANS